MWRDQGACRDHDPELWFPHPGETSKRRKAVNICDTVCTVKDACLRVGMTQPFGIWGGVTESARRKKPRRNPFTNSHRCDGENNTAQADGSPCPACQEEKML